MRVAINVRRGQEMEKQLIEAGIEPITKEAVKAMILADKEAAQQGAGGKASKRKREAACSKPEGQKPISSFFRPQPKDQDQAATGTFPWDQTAPSPPVKAKSPSAVIGSGFTPPFQIFPLIPY
jgi:hypothetical protein